MNSTLKPVLPQPGVPQTGGQSSPAKGNVATANHAVGLPQGAQNSLHHGSNNLVVQNLTHHVPNTPQLPPHPVPSMAPVTANMAQMAQNMSHHGNLSHVTQNSIAPTNMAVSPSKSASTSAPLSLVQDKANTSQPLALTRTPEKKEAEAAGQSNGIESPKSSGVPVPLKPQNPELKQDKQDIAKTSPSTPKPPEKPNTPSTPQKVEPSPSQAQSQAESPPQPKVATANEAPEKSPSKPSEPTPAPAADVAPTQSDNKPVPESASSNQVQENTTPKETAPAEIVKPVEEKQEVKEEVKDKPVEKEEKKEEESKEPEPPKPEPEKAPVEEKVEEKKVEKTPAKTEVKATPKSTLKLATVTPPMRKRRQLSDKSEGPSQKKSAEGDSTPDARTKRNRTKVQLYQSPTPEIAMATKLSASAGRSTPTKPNDDKLIVFYKNEYLAVRNAEGGFYVCQAMQNVYRTTRKIKIRWLSKEKSDANGEIYKPDFYDVTDMECVLTTLSLTRAGAGAGGGQVLRAAERERAHSILERALRAEQGGDVELTAEHPDGLDLSLYTDESQIEKKARKRNSSKSSPRAVGSADAAAENAVTPSKKARTTPKRSPKSVRKAKPKPKTPPIKRKSVGSTQSVATTKTATAVTEKAAKAKIAAAKVTPKTTPKPTKVETPVSARKGRRATKESPAPTPSTSSGKPSRSSRKTSY